MRDGSTYELDASYIEVTHGAMTTYTLLASVPDYPIAIVAAFPADIVQSVRAVEASREVQART